MTRLLSLLLSLLLVAAATPAWADLNVTPGSGAVLFDFTCFTTKHCGATVLVNSAGTEIGTASVPVQVSLANTSANAAAVLVNQPTAANLNATVVGTGTFVTQSVVTQATSSNLKGQVDPLTVATWGLFPGQNATTPTNAGLVAGQFNTSPTTITTGNSSPLQLDSAGNLLVNIKAGAGSGGTALADEATFTQGSTSFTPAGCTFNNSITNLTSGQGGAFSCTNDRQLKVSDATLLAAVQAPWPAGTNMGGFVGLQANTTGGCTPTHFLSAATTNSTNIKASAGTICSVTIVQNTATAADLRLYDSASAPTCSSATGVVANYGIQANTTSPGLSPNLGPFGLNFTTGIGFCLTAYDGTDTNNSAATTGLQLVVGWK